MDVVSDGWLENKPEARFMKAVASLHRKRRQWFVLKHSGNLPGQYVLEYYTDQTCRKLKGKIDLDQCQQVEAGITNESSKKDEYIFALRTNKRVYHLSSKSETEMNKWVSSICNVCGLQPQNLEEEIPEIKPALEEPSLDTLVSLNPPKETTTHSDNPYIPIFECYSGNPLEHDESRNNSTSEDNVALIPTSSLEPSSDFYDYPKPIPKFTIEDTKHLKILDNGPIYSNIESPLQNEVFLYDSVKPFAAERPSKEHQYLNLPPKEARTPNHGKDSVQPPIAAPPPPRPPKPQNLGDKHRRDSSASSCDTPTWAYEGPSDKSYLRKGSLASSLCRGDDSTDDDASPLVKIPLPSHYPTSPAAPDLVYDFPRIHLDTMALRKRHAYSNAPPGLFQANPPKESIFNYEYPPTPFAAESSPCTEAKKSEPSPTNYVNLPQPSPVSPPAIHRDLKPKRRESFDDAPKILTLAPPPQGRNKLSKPSSSDSEATTRKNSSDDADPLKVLRPEIQYLDLNLDSDSSIQSPKTPEKLPSTVYKTVDFVKTKAFNVMRLNAEQYRKPH